MKKMMLIGGGAVGVLVLVGVYFALRAPQAAAPREIRVAMTPEAIERGRFCIRSWETATGAMGIGTGRSLGRRWCGAGRGLRFRRSWDCRGGWWLRI
jgi:hypothetical protein